MLEQHKRISLLYDDIDLNEESDSLSEELDGWIKKYSAQGK